MNITDFIFNLRPQTNHCYQNTDQSVLVNDPHWVLHMRCFRDVTLLIVQTVRDRYLRFARSDEIPLDYFC